MQPQKPSGHVHKANRHHYLSDWDVRRWKAMLSERAQRVENSLRKRILKPPGMIVRESARREQMALLEARGFRRRKLMKLPIEVLVNQHFYLNVGCFRSRRPSEDRSRCGPVRHVVWERSAGVLSAHRPM